MRHLTKKSLFSLNGAFVALRQKVVDPPGECRSIFEVEYELAQKCGLDHLFPWSVRARTVSKGERTMSETPPTSTKTKLLIASLGLILVAPVAFSLASSLFGRDFRVRGRNKPPA